jgi:hypothetical protein
VRPASPIAAELAAIAAARDALDDRELAAIDAARRSGSTWAEVATALGLASRQAAEQRRRRLAAAARSRRHRQDARYGLSPCAPPSSPWPPPSRPTAAGTAGSRAPAWSARRSTAPARPRRARCSR